MANTSVCCVCGGGFKPESKLDWVVPFQVCGCELKSFHPLCLFKRGLFVPKNPKTLRPYKLQRGGEGEEEEDEEPFQVQFNPTPIRCNDCGQKYPERWQAAVFSGLACTHMDDFNLEELLLREEVDLFQRRGFQDNDFLLMALEWLLINELYPENEKTSHLTRMDVMPMFMPHTKASYKVTWDVKIDPKPSLVNVVAFLADHSIQRLGKSAKLAFKLHNILAGIKIEKKKGMYRSLK